MRWPDPLRRPPRTPAPVRRLDRHLPHLPPTTGCGGWTRPRRWPYTSTPRSIFRSRRRRFLPRPQRGRPSELQTPGQEHDLPAFVDRDRARRSPAGCAGHAKAAGSSCSSGTRRSARPGSCTRRPVTSSPTSPFWDHRDSSGWRRLPPTVFTDVSPTIPLSLSTLTAEALHYQAISAALRPAVSDSRGRSPVDR